MIHYEYPLHERVRTYLRLEHLFKHLDQLLGRADPLDHHFALVTLFEIMDVGARADLKSDVLKDLDRQKHLLEGYRGNPVIAEEVLEAVIEAADRSFNDLSSQNGKAGQPLTENDWLMGIRSRIAIPGGTCEFDLPSYYRWQHNGLESRQSDLQQWIAPLEPLKQAVALLLKLMRDGGSPQKVMANNGQLQLNLPQSRSYLMVRLGLDASLDVWPEVSGNRLLISVRLMRTVEDQRSQACGEDVSLELSLCA